MGTTFSKRLKELRKERGLTQSQTAKVLDYGYTAIANYESERNEPSLSDLCRIADFFNVTTDYLLGQTDNRHKCYGVSDFIGIFEDITIPDVLYMLLETNITKIR